MGMKTLTLGSGESCYRKILLTGTLFQCPQLEHFILSFVGITKTKHPFLVIYLSGAPQFTQKLASDLFLTPQYEQVIMLIVGNSLSLAISDKSRKPSAIL